jgi:hypothetical protein
MTQDFGTPVPPPIEYIPSMPPVTPKKSNRTWIIIAIVAVVLCCCCVVVVGGYLGWTNYGPQILEYFNFTG